MIFRRVLLCSVVFVSGLSAQTDDFDDGDDLGWTRLDPLGGLGAGAFASFGFGENSYQISATESPSPSEAGPARAGSLRQDVIYNDRLFISVDITIENTNLEQAIGFLAFVQPNPALGATSGYSLNYQPSQNDLILNRITNEAPTRLNLSNLTAAASEFLRLILVCENGQLTGKLFNRNDLLHPIAVVSATDSMYTSGTAGLFVFADTDDATGIADASFDNYHANALIRPVLKIEAIGEGDYELKWPSWAAHFQPESSPDLKNNTWLPITDQPLVRGEFFVLTGEFSAETSAFFRLSESRD